MVPGAAAKLITAYPGLAYNGRHGVEGRAFAATPTREQLRKLWLDIFDAQFQK